MLSGYSKTPLVKKLGIKPGFRICVIDPPSAYWDLLGPLPEHVSVYQPGAVGLDLIHVFARDKRQLEARIGVLRESIAPAGMLWVSWPKKSARVATDLDENVIRDLALANGLVDTKVAAVDETWSGLKLVIRVKDRKSSTPSSTD
jgi:hypothetical protein